jgi:beta-glucosidase/6-phospho-beta-glucosidase/beta-galactosidase
LISADGEGKVNEEGVAYYNNLIDYLLEKGTAIQHSLASISTTESSKGT